MNGILDARQINEDLQKDPRGYIEACEAQFRKMVLSVADSIADLPGNRLVMLAGPSSSGKTTTAKLLAEEFAARSRRAKTISLDDFYLGKDLPFRFEDGTPDYETIHSLDVPLIRSCLRALAAGETCHLPRFSFQTGEREQALVETRLEPDEVVIVEGLHALNPLVTGALDPALLTRVYVSVSTRVAMDNEVLLSKRALRFIRRMVRDYQFRNSPVNHTFYLWNGVRKGEDRYLFPFSSLAEVRLDSIHPYEPCAFRSLAMDLLRQVEPDSAYAPTAETLKEKLEFFVPLDLSLVPQNSLLREFIGQSFG